MKGDNEMNMMPYIGAALALAGFFVVMLHLVMTSSDKSKVLEKLAKEELQKPDPSIAIKAHIDNMTDVFKDQVKAYSEAVDSNAAVLATGISDLKGQVDVLKGKVEAMENHGKLLERLLSRPMKIKAAKVTWVKESAKPAPPNAPPALTPETKNQLNEIKKKLEGM